MKNILSSFISICLITAAMSFILPSGPFPVLWYGDGSTEASMAPTHGVLATLVLVITGVICVLRLISGMLGAMNNPETKERDITATIKESTVDFH